ncbi:class II fructose-bisphosphate aldolase [Chimaeribacter arupi]|uniref:class II fructose-bisphosphate aldolase n=1 Tax=Chimaeribacter arupi TaxID=2060066 RepID=UPI003CE5C202
MPYIAGDTLIRHAWQQGYAIGAFSAHNAETVLAILEAAEAEQSPVMIQIGQKVINTLGMRPMKALVDAWLDRVTVPVCVHLDHSRSFEQTMEAVRCGFQSVMFDGSHLPFDENVRITHAVADVAHALHIGCEGEIGKIGGVEDEIDVAEEDALITGCDEALAFVQATGVDYLAVSIGTAHGLYKKTPRLAFDRLAGDPRSRAAAGGAARRLRRAGRSGAPRHPPRGRQGQCGYRVAPGVYRRHGGGAGR